MASTISWERMTSHPHASSYSQDYFKKVLVVIFTTHIVDFFLFIFLFFYRFNIYYSVFLALSAFHVMQHRALVEPVFRWFRWALHNACRLRRFGAQSSAASSLPHYIRQGALDPWRFVPLHSWIRYCFLSCLFSNHLNTASQWRWVNRGLNTRIYLPSMNQPLQIRNKSSKINSLELICICWNVVGL